VRAALSSEFSSAHSLGAQTVTAAYGTALIISHVFFVEAVNVQMADAWRVLLGSAFFPSVVNAAHVLEFGSVSRDTVRDLSTSQLAAA
jgi:hypothetical protein